MSVASLLPSLVSFCCSLRNPTPRGPRQPSTRFDGPPQCLTLGPRVVAFLALWPHRARRPTAQARARARALVDLHTKPRATPARARVGPDPPFRHRFGSFLPLPFPRARRRGPSPLTPVVKDNIDPFQRHARPLSRGPFRALVERHQTPHQPACAPTATRFHPTLAHTDRGGASPSCAGKQRTSASGRVGGAAVSLGQLPVAARGRRRCALPEVGLILLRGGSSAPECFGSVDCFVSLLCRCVGPLRRSPPSPPVPPPTPLPPSSWCLYTPSPLCSPALQP